VTESANAQVPLDWSRDGRLVLFYEVAPAGESQPLEVVVNWTALLKQGSGRE
jgi:hypothetical protein